MMHRLLACWLAALSLACLVLPSPTRAADAPDQDRRSILAMAGDYRVDFDMREDEQIVGFEAIRVIEDRGGFISLQHLLVVGDMVVKHWREDWTFQPREVLTNQGEGRWALRAVAPPERAGAWSQTIWSGEDGPRYGGVGRWTYAGGLASWQSDQTRRPLALRDAARKPVYSWYEGWNRISLTPTGWVQDQDNVKLGLRDGRPTAFVRETVINSYARNDSFAIKAAEDYWAKTKDYWAGVRAGWAAAISRERGLKSAADDSDDGPTLAGVALDLAAGRKSQAVAAKEAGDMIAKEFQR